MSNLQKMQGDLEKAATVRDALMFPFVKERFIKNYQDTTGRQDGENRFANELFHYIGLCEENDKLKKCKRFSHFAAIVKAGVTGLSFAKEGQLYPIPYGDVVKIQIGAHGKRELLRRMPTVKDVLEGQVVYKGDVFTVDKLNSRVIKHEAAPPKSLGLDNIVAAYCRILYNDGTHVDVVVYHDEITKAKAASRNAGENSVWEKWPSEMAKKVTYNRAYKLYYSIPQTSGETIDLKPYEADDDDAVVYEQVKAEPEAPSEKAAQPEPAAATPKQPTVTTDADEFLKD